MKRGRPFQAKPALYVLPHGIEVVGEYRPNARFPYWRVRIRPHPFFPGARVVSDGCDVKRSHAVLASKIGQALPARSHVHHRDEDCENDHPENLELLTPAQHNRRHKLGSRHRADSKARIAASLKRAHAEGRRKPVIIGQRCPVTGRIRSTGGVS